MFGLFGRGKAVPKDSGDFVYRAFISYSRKDAHTARWLRRRLASWRTPREVVGEPSPVGPIPRAVGAVFLDTVNASSGSNVHQVFDRHLADTQTLVVLASPASARPESYVNTEIARFRELRPDGKIVSVIAEGDPPACFPRGLGYTDEKGEQQWPISPDLRGGPGRETRAEAIAKIVAGLFGLNDADRLIQSDRRRRRTRAAFISATAACAAIALAYAGGWVSVETKRTALMERQGPGWIAALPPRGSLYPFGNVVDAAERQISQVDVEIAAVNDPGGTWCRDQSGIPALSKDERGLRIWSEAGDGKATFLLDESLTEGCENFAPALNRFARVVDGRAELWSIRPARLVKVLAENNPVEACVTAAGTPLRDGVTYASGATEAPACFNGSTLKFLPGDQRLVTRNAEGTVAHIWSAETGARVTSVLAPRPEYQSTEQPSVYNFEPQYDVTSHLVAAYFENTVFVTDLRSGKTLGQHRFDGPVLQLHFAGAGKTLFAVTANQLHILRADTAEPVKSLALSGAEPAAVHPIDDAGRLLVELEDRLLLIDSVKGDVLKDLPYHRMDVVHQPTIARMASDVVLAVDRVAPSILRLRHPKGDSLIDLATGRTIFGLAPNSDFLAFASDSSYGLLDTGSDLRFVNLPDGSVLSRTGLPSVARTAEDRAYLFGHDASDPGISVEMQSHAEGSYRRARTDERFWAGDKLEVEVTARINAVAFTGNRRLTMIDPRTGRVIVDSAGDAADLDANHCRSIRLDAYQKEVAGLVEAQAAAQRPAASASLPGPPDFESSFPIGPDVKSLQAALAAQAAQAAMPESADVQSIHSAIFLEQGEKRKHVLDQFAAEFAAKTSSCAGADRVALSPDGSIVAASDERAQITRIWRVATGRLIASMPGTLISGAIGEKSVVTRFGRTVISLATLDDKPSIQSWSLNDTINPYRSPFFEQPEVLAIESESGLWRLDVRTAQLSRIPMPENAFVYQTETARYLVLRHDDRVELFDVQEGKVIATRSRRRVPDRADASAASDLVQGASEDSLVAVEGATFGDRTDGFTVFDLTAGRVLQAGELSAIATRTQVMDLDLPYAFEGEAPEGGDFFERKNGRWRPIGAVTLRAALCERLGDGIMYKRASLLSWARGSDDGDFDGLPDELPEKDAKAAKLGYSLFKGHVVKTQVCEERGPLSAEFWLGIPARMSLW